MRTLPLAAVGLAAAVTLAVLAGLGTGRSGHAAPAGGQALRMLPAGSAGRHPVAYGCRGWHQGQVRPAFIPLSCFGSAVLKTDAWAYWTARSARSARATLEVDTCKPTCVAGKFRKYPATVFLYRVRSHSGVRFYSRLRIRYRHGGPRSYTFRWARYPGATIPVWVGGPSGRS